MKTLEYFEVTQNTDKTEGRGVSTGTGIAFEQESDAIKFASSDYYKPYAIMGVVSDSYAKHNVRKVSINVWESFDSYDKEKNDVIMKKRKALAKLSDEERELLGL